MQNPEVIAEIKEETKKVIERKNFIDSLEICLKEEDLNNYFKLFTFCDEIRLAISNKKIELANE